MANNTKQPQEPTEQEIKASLEALLRKAAAAANPAAPSQIPAQPADDSK